MGLANPKNPLSINPGAASDTDPSVLSTLGNRTLIQQIRGITVNGSTGAGIPKAVGDVKANISNGSAGATSVINVQFRRDPSDSAFAGVRILATGYQGNNTAVQVGSSTDSPATVILNNTGEAISIIIQPYGNGGNTPLASCPSIGVQLPKSAGGGVGTTTTTQLVTQQTAPVGSLTGTAVIFSGQNGVIGNKTLDVSTEGTLDWCIPISGGPADSGEMKCATKYGTTLAGFLAKYYNEMAGTAGVIGAISTTVNSDAADSANGAVAATNSGHGLNPASGSASNLGIGFRVTAPASSTTTRNLNLYVFAWPGALAGSPTQTVTIKAVLDDGTVTPLTLTFSSTATNGNMDVWKVNLQFKSGSVNARLEVKAEVTAQSSGSSTVGLLAATLF